jgi:hypothetical protein
MAFNDIEKKRIEKSLDGFLAKRRPPVHVRPDLDIGYRLSEQSVEIIEIRPQWDDRTIIREYPVANATYIRTQDLWKVFWKRADLEWHGYEPALTVASIDEFLTVVDQDKHACFFG